MKQLEIIQDNMVSYSIIVAGFVVYLGMCTSAHPLGMFLMHNRNASNEYKAESVN